jgi:vancomycin aglycone glucosyltransferase
MRVLLSVIGSRGDVQPVVALAAALRDLGQEAKLCVPPDFREWIEGLGFEVVSLGPEVRQTAKVKTPPTAEQRRQLIDGTVATQFATIGEAAKGCDVILGFVPLQIAARSTAEMLGIPYVFGCLCPITLPSGQHAPPAQWNRAQKGDNRTLWAEDAKQWNDNFGPALNAHRIAAGLAPVADVRSHLFTDQPWLAADATLAPWPDPTDPNVVQTGAWILPDDRPLSAELEAFLAAGEAPIYFGFGSIRATEDLSQAMIKAARELGRRAILSRGWADLALLDDGSDCLSIGEVNQQALFQRVAAVVHHGGAGTTTAATRAGVPQVIVPQLYDQFYFADQLGRLGIGTAHAPGVPTADSLVAALKPTFELAARAKEVAQAVRADGATVAAKRLIGLSRTIPG